MSEALMFILIFAAVIAITSVVFWVWMLAMVGRVCLRMGRFLFGLFIPEPRAPEQIEAGTVHCPRHRCRAINPVNAHFCRRCGQELLRSRFSQRHAAMW